MKINKQATIKSVKAFLSYDFQRMQYLTFINYKDALKQATDERDKPQQMVLLNVYTAKHELMIVASAINACGKPTKELFYLRYQLHYNTKQIAKCFDKHPQTISQWFKESYLQFADEYTKRGRNLIAYE